jgi:hypothetical protein
MSVPAGRRSALARLAVAYLRHLVGRRLRPARPGTAGQVLEIYRSDRLSPLTSAERLRLPTLSRCVNCGLCALAAGRVAGVRPADLATAYLRDYSLLPAVRSEVDGLGGGVSSDPVRAALEAAAAACPTGVPLAEVAAAVYRLSRT